MTDSAGDAFHTVELSDPALERDGLRIATVRSRALGCRTDVSFWIPPGAKSVPTLLILLHGVYGSHWVWAWKGAAHQTAARLVRAGEISPLILAMPSDGLVNDGSGYLSWPGGPDVERFIIEEVPRLCSTPTARLPLPVWRWAGMAPCVWAQSTLTVSAPSVRTRRLRRSRISKVSYRNPCTSTRHVPLHRNWKRPIG